jgi:tripartite-type tricarboxylate transporter receptor subunit TctC
MTSSAPQPAGILAPTGTPVSVVKKLNAEIAAALKAPEFRDRIAVHGILVIASSPAEFTAVIGKDLVRWRKVVQEANIKGE